MKAIYFDMDGTLADMFNYPDWLRCLKREDVRPYRDCEPIVNLGELVPILKQLRNLGVHVGVISWLAKGSSISYAKATRAAKMEWLQNHIHFEFDSIKICRYGAPKHNYAMDDSILVDDSPFCLSTWTKGRTLDASQDWIAELRYIVNHLLSTG